MKFNNILLLSTALATSVAITPKSYGDTMTELSSQIKKLQSDIKGLENDVSDKANVVLSIEKFTDSSATLLKTFVEKFSPLFDADFKTADFKNRKDVLNLGKKIKELSGDCSKQILELNEIIFKSLIDDKANDLKTFLLDDKKFPICSAIFKKISEEKNASNLGNLKTAFREENQIDFFNEFVKVSGTKVNFSKSGPSNRELYFYSGITVLLLAISCIFGVLLIKSSSKSEEGQVEAESDETED
jgi:hypothetical protein